jgi:HAD superfamily phosphoserine phosphatase-like hydrolase
MKIVYVDFDGTLVRSNSFQYLYFNLWHTWTTSRTIRTLATFMACALAYPLLVMAHYTDSRLRDRLTYFFYWGLSQKDLEEAAEVYFQKRQVLIPQTKAFLQEKKQAGYSIVIISGSIREVVVQASQQLDLADVVDHVITARLVYKGQVANGRMMHPPMVEEEKVRAIHAFEKGLNVQDRICVSDSWSDRPMLDLGRHSVVINPDSKLKIHAVNKNWDIWFV